MQALQNPIPPPVVIIGVMRTDQRPNTTEVKLSR